jgi:hypothetical protein
LDLDALLREAVSAHAADFSGAEDRAREEFRAALSQNLLNAEVAISNAICAVGYHMRKRIEIPTTEHISYQIALSCDFDRCRFVTKKLLEGGNINEAITLIRRLVESLARLRETEILSLEELIGKTPNIKHSLGPASRMYGELSKIAHSSDPGLMDFLKVSARGESSGPSPYPRFHSAAVNYFELFLYLCLSYVLQMARLLDTWYPTVDKRLLQMAVIGMLFDSFKAGLIDNAVA